MKEKIKIAIFGLSLNIQEDVKAEVDAIFKDKVPIDWVSINESQIDILLLNDLFFNSKIVQAHIQNKGVPYLRLLASESRSGVMEGDTLYLPFKSTDQINAWFNERYLQVPLRSQLLKQNEVNHNELDIHKTVTELLDENNGNLQVFDQFGIIALLNTKTEQVWMDSSRKVKGTNSSLNYTYATMQMTQEKNHLQGIDIYQWLWNLFWNSPQLSQKINTSMSYKLMIWPKYDDESIYKKLLVLSACFEKGASLHQVNQKTGIDLEFIQRFISVGLLSKTIKEINPHEAALNKEVKDQSEETINSFFGKFKVFGRFPNWSLKF